MILRPERHQSSITRTEISVDRSDDELVVELKIQPEAGETFDDLDMIRTLHPSEARELAAMLYHHADALDRRIR